MNTQNPEINWDKELRGEVGLWSISLLRYPLGSDINEVERFVVAAVYQLLSGQKAKTDEENHFLWEAQENNDAAALAVETIALGSMTASQESNFEIEWEEAVHVGREAREKIERDPEQGLTPNFKKHYEYWRGRKIGDSIQVVTLGEKPNQYFVGLTPHHEVGEKTGFPDNILERGINQKMMREMGTNSLTFFQEKVNNYASKGENIMQGLFNEAAGDHFEEILRKTRPNEGHDGLLWKAIRMQMRWAKHDPAEIFAQMTPEEQAEAEKPKEYTLGYRVKFPLKLEETEAELWLTSVFEKVTVWFDRGKNAMMGTIEMTDKDDCQAMVWSKVTPQTSHEHLLELRKKAITICDELGLK